MPRERFRHPEDAAEQLAVRGRLHERLFGTGRGALAVGGIGLRRDGAARRPTLGFKWMATDEVILARSLGLSFSRDGRWARRSA